MALFFSVYFFIRHFDANCIQIYGNEMKCRKEKRDGRENREEKICVDVRHNVRIQINLKLVAVSIVRPFRTNRIRRCSEIVSLSFIRSSSVAGTLRSN